MLRIAIPSYKSREAIYIIILTGLLVIRTYMSIWLADVNGKVVKAIVNRDLADFLKKVHNIYLRDLDIWARFICHSFIDS